MLKNRPNEDKFDRMLGRALQKHSEPVPADFTERILRQIEEVKQKLKPYKLHYGEVSIVIEEMLTELSNN